ncbi:dachshund protein [Aphelenchoides avenae]|nr:dachshund protein [Aphelenchus avenae]
MDKAASETPGNSVKSYRPASRSGVAYGQKDRNDPSNTVIFDFRGERVAGFRIEGKDMLCMPQVYELFLKHLVGGLHTVYTKLKRLQINPIICNVEQVRSLRSVGAVQAGVNRCKLIDKEDFDTLLADCANTA